MSHPAHRGPLTAQTHTGTTHRTKRIKEGRTKIHITLIGPIIFLFFNNLIKDNIILIYPSPSISGIVKGVRTCPTRRIRKVVVLPLRPSTPTFIPYLRTRKTTLLDLRQFFLKSELVILTPPIRVAITICTTGTELLAAGGCLHNPYNA